MRSAFFWEISMKAVITKINFEEHGVIGFDMPKLLNALWQLQVARLVSTRFDSVDVTGLVSFPLGRLEEASVRINQAGIITVYAADDEDAADDEEFTLWPQQLKQPSMKVDDVIDLLTDTLDSLRFFAQRELENDGDRPETSQLSYLLCASCDRQMAINGIQSGDLKK